MSTTTTAPLRPIPRGTVVAVAGISQYQDTAARVHIGDEVVLKHETSNPYDVDAVRIDTLDGATIGYLSRNHQLNSRLLVNHRGGVWAGLVVERYDGETIGLRVKITELLGHRDPAFGSDHPGRRDRTDHDEPTAADTPAGSSGGPADGGVTPPTLVRARSGRVLGTLVEHQGTKVRVRNADGQVVAFPAAVVAIDTAAADALPQTA